uniref:Uncharacterized protein n=1 Tax=Peach sooty ringspot virus TaxID=145398 RepID=Q9DKY7_9VIRU|nr:unknown [Peach sooty ringspot virus]
MFSQPPVHCLQTPRALSSASHLLPPSVQLHCPFQSQLCHKLRHFSLYRLMISYGYDRWKQQIKALGRGWDLVLNC